MARPKNLLRPDFPTKMIRNVRNEKGPFKKGQIYLLTIKFHWIFLSFKEFWINWWSYFTPIHGRKSMGDKFQWTFVRFCVGGWKPRAHHRRGCSCCVRGSLVGCLVRFAHWCGDAQGCPTARLINLPSLRTRVSGWYLGSLFCGLYHGKSLFFTTIWGIYLGVHGT